MKRYLIIIIVVLTAGAGAALIYFTKDNISFTKETSMFKAVPISSPAFVELNSLKSIPLDNPVIKEWFENDRIERFVNWVEELDSIVQNNKDIQSGLRTEPFILAFGFVGENDLYPLIIKKAENGNKQHALRNLIRAMYPASKNVYDEISYSGHKISSINAEKNINEFHYSFSGGLFICSSKLLLVEQAIRQMNETSITENANFSKVHKTVTSQSKFSWYINHKLFPDLISVWMNRKTESNVNEFGENVRFNVSRNIQNFKKYAAWSELDVEFDDNEILFNGISTANDSSNHFLSVFEGQEPVRFKADDVLPQNTSFYLSYTFSNKALFFENLEKYFSHTESYYKREDRIKKIETTFRTDFKNTFQGIVKNEVILAATNIPVELGQKSAFFILQTEGKSNAESQINGLLTSHAQRKKIELSSLITKYSVDPETHFLIYKFPYPSFPGIWFGKPFGFVDANYAAFFNNSLVFCNSEKGLQDYLYSMVLETTLSKDSRYMRFKQKMENKANINVFLNVNRSFNLGAELFDEEVYKILNENEEFLKKFQAVNWQLINEKEIFFNSIYLAFNSNNTEEAQTTWQSNVGNQIVSKPAFTLNHDDRDNLEVIVQDDENKLHQITKEGRVRWSVPIDEQILSEIHQVDYLGNGKMQYLFNTKSKLFLIDRNGNKVAHFPVAFRSPATNGVSVFDYDNNKKYRYFVACDDKKVYAYDKEGKILTGWEFQKTDFPVTTPVQHFRVSNKDYIVFKDKSRIYIQNRKGATRVNTSAKFENSKNPLILDLNGKPKIVTTDKKGKVFYIYFDGKYVEKEVGNFGEDHFFNVADINGNGVPDFVFVDDKELTVLDENGKKLFAEKFKNPIEFRPEIYAFSSKVKKIGVVDFKANRIYLYDPEGDLHDGFPLQGNSEFTIGELSKNSGQLNLIVGSKGGNLYNYTLN